MRLYLLIMLAGCGSSGVVCLATNNCTLINGVATCNDGYDWDDVDDPENFICVSIAVCGDGVVEANEECEGMERMISCSEYSDIYTWGELGCNSDCTYRFNNCEKRECGNGAHEPPEECDGNQAWETCEDHGFAGGGISCTENCVYDLSLCYK